MFLQRLGVVNDTTLDSVLLVVAINPHVVVRAKKLLAAEDDPCHPPLRSGLYVLRPCQEDPSLIYVVYWPEQTTWNDDADESVRRNRVTFMRYVRQIKANPELFAQRAPSFKLPHQDH
jgi:hypothetical protein